MKKIERIKTRKIKITKNKTFYMLQDIGFSVVLLSGRDPV